MPWVAQPVSVHQVQHREAARRLGRVLRRQIDIAGALRPRQGGVVFLDADLPVRDVLLQVIVHARLGNLDAAGPEARAEEQPAVRVGNPLPVHIQRVIVETGHEGFRLGFPNAVRTLHHRIVLAAHVHGDGLGLGIVVAEHGRQVRIDLRERLTGLVRGRGRRLGEDADGFLLNQIRPQARDFLRRERVHAGGMPGGRPVIDELVDVRHFRPAELAQMLDGFVQDMRLFPVVAEIPQAGVRPGEGRDFIVLGHIAFGDAQEPFDQEGQSTRAVRAAGAVEKDRPPFAQIADDGPDRLLIQLLRIAGAAAEILLHGELDIFHAFHDRTHIRLALLDAAEVQVDGNAQVFLEDFLGAVRRPAAAQRGAAVQFSIGDVPAVGLPTAQVTHVRDHPGNHAHRADRREAGRGQDLPVAVQHLVVVFHARDQVIDLGDIRFDRDLDRRLEERRRGHQHLGGVSFRPGDRHRLRPVRRVQVLPVFPGEGNDIRGVGGVIHLLQEPTGSFIDHADFDLLRGGADSQGREGGQEQESSFHARGCFHITVPLRCSDVKGEHGYHRGSWGGSGT